MAQDQIRVVNARQNNLKNINVTVPVGAVTVVTGVAGAGKSSLAFDVLYAEGYRRYVETFSPYARQFLERLDRPEADRIEGVLPAISIARTSPVQTSRSTVGTMTSIDDYLRSLFARAAHLYCRGCGRPVHRESPEHIFDALLARGRDTTALICFSRPVGDAGPEDVRETLEQAGFSRVLEQGRALRIEEAGLDYGAAGPVTVVLDRVKLRPAARARIIDSIEAALQFGHGRIQLQMADSGETLHFSNSLHCPVCDIDYAEPTAALFSFNNPVGACETCNGFGRIIDIDPDLVIPDPGQSIANGAIRPFQTQSYSACQNDLMAWMRKNRLPADTPWQDLDSDLRERIWTGDGSWYGIDDFFDWLKSRRYKKHARIFLSRFRRYLTCPDCRGARLKPGSLLFQIKDKNFAQIEQMAIQDAQQFFRDADLDGNDRATEMLLSEIRDRLEFLCDVGLGYLSLGRQSRTLSGGETQRVTLATALGASLTSTLYVLDEPSVGLHPGDKQRLAGVLSKLAAAGNAVVVVEHDAAFIRGADRIIDLGPGPGIQGGHVVHQGTPAGLLKRKNSKTAAYFRGDLQIPRPEHRRPPGAKKLHITGAREHNLKNIDLEIPLGLLVCVTGVSGSGKSTLVDHVVYRNLRRQKGLEIMEPGACNGIAGHHHVSDAVLVDQSPLSRNTRMNAATYMGVLDPIRTAFAGTRAAKQMGLTKSAFSFNTPAGACPHCQGAGYERVELQFLPDVYVRCPGCDGRRFRPYVLDVHFRGYHIADVLSLPARDVAELFSDRPAVVDALVPMIDIGLGYLSLSQSAPTLSGGEAQRLKLARHLARARHAENLLFLLDEPTTGLHPDNVADLAGCLQQLANQGHSVMVIEHDMDLARSADWIIDMGPAGGDDGGRITGQGTPEHIAGLDTLTARAMQNIAPDVSEIPESAGRRGKAVFGKSISIRGAREHNLADISVEIPKNRLVCVTGVSGSGKSTLAFDVLYSEGRERFLDCLPVYARQYMQPLSRPDVDRVESLPPTVALEQKISRAGAMSTAGTASEVYHYLRLLFSALGSPFCPGCGVAGQTADAAEITRQILRRFDGAKIRILAPLVRKRKGYHADVIARALADGFAFVRIDGKFYESAAPPKLDRYGIHDVEAMTAEVMVDRKRPEQIRTGVKTGLEAGAGAVIVTAADQKSRGRDHFFSTRRACPECGAGLPQADPRLFTWSQQFGACQVCQGTGRVKTGDSEPDTDVPVCPACSGTRLRPEALAVKINNSNIGEVAAMTISGVRKWLHGLDAVSAEVSQRVLPEINARLQLLENLGVGYLTLDRPSNTLSTGEAQRVRIAAEISSNLRGVCYVLDEPTVGLHPKNAQALVSALCELRDRGNTVVVVEHEEPVIRAADHVIDLGPGAGVDGGRVVAAGTPKSLEKNRASVTGQWLGASAAEDLWRRRSLENCPCLTVSGASCHNLSNVSVDFPLGRLVCVTGVSGSGKSTLVRDVTFRAVRAALAGRPLPKTAAGLSGMEWIKSAKEVDESPIGRTPRSVPATYVGIMDEIRRIFAMTPEARARGYTAGRFSFNVSGGRCEACGGQGRHRVEMPLLPVVHIPCDVCGGRRYNPETLAVRFKDRSIAGVLDMTVDEALDFFSAFPKLLGSLQFLSDIGLGYVKLGQPSPTLSGGEAQRMKLAAELTTRSAGGGFYVLDEPTTGLHMADVAKLVSALQQMADRGDTVVVIEHDMDLIAAADCVIDMGPGGGEMGGKVVARGTPEMVASSAESLTAAYLREKLAAAQR
ncbi:excinuclease ABC subunit A [Desulfosalsimonas propionicica]|uniref:UvrABC system protein A n=1 Tax=Desulfosalsimonas propionicica TaxID=332175 RepID=A0A7W0C6Q9_9BACT|nr:excinuclease ABC subunit UvrA [Desulfosalsimonas propionicica]MBA2880147.1 excinuclease ABC subunit A [Desulfosalsimonas propionicica]